MRFSVVALLSAAGLAAATCPHDNCLRAVIASAFTTRHGSADCQSYFATTVGTGPVATQTTIPTAIPAYASPCSGAAAYSSACSCVGATATTTTVSATVSGYPFLGCFTDTSDRLLTGGGNGNYYGPSTMSNEICAEYCASIGYQYFGTEYSYQCFCGNALENTDEDTPAPGQCNAPCAGNPTETCGGTWLIDVFGPNPAVQTS